MEWINWRKKRSVGKNEGISGEIVLENIKRIVCPLYTV
jgi:hypothetical protein